jgi:hypothetical protein
MELIASAGKATPLSKRAPVSGKVLGGEDLSEMFGLDMAENEPKASAKKKKRTGVR